MKYLLILLTVSLYAQEPPQELFLYYRVGPTGTPWEWKKLVLDPATIRLDVSGADAKLVIKAPSVPLTGGPTGLIVADTSKTPTEIDIVIPALQAEVRRTILDLVQRLEAAEAKLAQIPPPPSKASQ
jgi:hypothetical protein